MQTFAPIWLTSESQLRSLEGILARASLASKLLARFDIPAAAPQVRGTLLPWMRAPLVFQSAGELAVSDASVGFTARRQRLFGWRLLNVDDSLAFTLEAREIVDVASCSFRSPVARVFDLPFIRIRTTRNGALGQFLLCVGAKVNQRHITRETSRLLGVLQSLTARAAASVR